MYIRTKDGVYEVKKAEILCGVKFYDYETREDFVNRIREEQIINQSENLEELCDCFVKIWCNVKVNPEVLIYDEQYEEEKENMLLVYPKGNIAIYGAIWTDKGLIYVAKMDNEGKMVLI